QLISEGDRKSGQVAWGRPGTWPGEALLVELVDTGDSSPPASGRLGSSPREGTWSRRLSKRGARKSFRRPPESRRDVRHAIVEEECSILVPLGGHYGGDPHRTQPCRCRSGVAGY